MPEKTYKFISVCERPKPVQTNNAYQFTWHVAFCKTCLEKLPESILKQLEPRLSQFKSERAKKELPTEQKSPIETISDEKIAKGMKPGIIVEEKSKLPPPPEPPKPKADKQQQSQFDSTLKDSPVFQGLAKSMEEVKTEITGQINALGDMMQTRMEQVFKGISGEGAVEETKKEPPPDQTPPPGNPPETNAPSGNVDLGGRPSGFGQPDQIPAAMQPGYKAGDKPPPQIPPSDTPPSGEQPPFGGGQLPLPGEQEPPPDTTQGKGLPQLNTPEQLSTFKEYLAGEEKRLAGEGKAPTKKVDDMLGTAKSSVGLLKEVVDIFRGRGEAQQSALANTPIGDMLAMVKGVNDLTMGNFKGMFEMIKAVREAEKLIWTEPSAKLQPSPERKEPPSGESVSTG